MARTAAQSEEAAGVLHGIREATGRTASRIEQFHRSIAEMDQHVHEIADRMSQLAALTEENTATAQRPGVFHTPGPGRTTLRGVATRRTHAFAL